MAEVIRFEPNQPQLIALAFTEGKPVESQFTGSQVMFSTVDGRRMYLAPFVAEKIREAGIAARQQFELCKKQVGREVQWEVRTHNAAGSVSKAKPTAPVRSLNESVQPGYIDQQRAQMAQRIEAARPATSLSPMAAKILAAYVVAFEVVEALNTVAQQRGLELDFQQEEHIRTIAATAFIEANKTNGGRA